MSAWRVLLSGVDITASVSAVEIRAATESICTECSVEIADRSILSGVVVHRIPTALALQIDERPASTWVNRGRFFIEQIGHPQDLASKTARLWGRSASARLGAPWAPKISRQWDAATTIDAIVQEMAALCGVTVTVADDFPVCQYCYAVSDQLPSQIIQDLALKSGQICWPQADGSLAIAPRIYPATGYGTPDVTLAAADVLVQSVERTTPDFGNRILVSGDGAVAGLSVTVVPMYTSSTCVAANGADQVRLLAVVLDADGDFVATGTSVAWGASAGSLDDATSLTGAAEIIGEEHRADSYYQINLDLPASAVVGVYAYDDPRRKRNLYATRRGSVSGRVITFLSPLDYFDQAVIVDYEVAGAINTWTSGWAPGDVTILASVAGAQGQAVIHQSNPTACASSLVLESVPSNVCIGASSVITAKARMFGGAGSGAITFLMSGCGELSSTVKTLATHAVTETVRVSNWGGVSQVQLSAVPMSDEIDIHTEASPTVNLYDSHSGGVVNLNAVLESGVQVIAEYPGGGTAFVRWTPSGAVTGETLVREQLASVVDGSDSKVTLSRTPNSVVMITQSSTWIVGPDLYESNAGAVVTLNTSLPAATALYCTYWADQPLQPDCQATIYARVEDGSQDGATASITVTAKDCRTQTTDPTLPPDDTDPSDPGGMPEDEDEEEDEATATGCDAISVQARTPTVTEDNWGAISGVSTTEDCPGLCTCDQICTALRANGTLGKAGLFYSQCMAKCNSAQTKACTPCELSGPTELAPGATGTWEDDKGNAGEASGDLRLISRTVEDGYTFQMPSGGQGPFTVRVCYGAAHDQCCEAEVDFPPCSMTGPSELAQDQEGEFVPSLGMTGASATVSNMVLTTPTSTAIKAKLAPGACAGSINVWYGGRLCGSKTVTDEDAGVIGAVVGPSALEPGETGYFAHNMGAGAVYTGTLTMVSAGSGGAVLMMPESAQMGQSYSAAWSGRCGVDGTASVAVNDMPSGYCKQLDNGGPYGGEYTNVYGCPQGSWFFNNVWSSFPSPSNHFATWDECACWSGNYSVGWAVVTATVKRYVIILC